MIHTPQHIFSMFGLFIIMLFIAGTYCILMTRNLMRTLIGLELLTKAVTILIIVAGYVTGNIALAQAIVVTLIVVEVVVIVVMVGIILSIHRHTGSINANSIRNLKG